VRLFRDENQRTNIYKDRNKYNSRFSKKHEANFFLWENVKDCT